MSTILNYQNIYVKGMNIKTIQLPLLVPDSLTVPRVPCKKYFFL